MQVGLVPDPEREMNIFGMGPLELVLIVVLALVVFGPEKLPEVFGQIGRFVRDVRKLTTDVSAEFNQAMALDLEGSAATPSPPPVPELPRKLSELTSDGAAPAPNGAASNGTAPEPASSATTWAWEESPAASVESEARPTAAPDDQAPPY
jgi:Tat protein translocase TatB subunit